MVVVVVVAVVEVGGARVPELAWSFETVLAPCPSLNEKSRGNREACSSTVAAVPVVGIIRLATRTTSRTNPEALRGRRASSFLGSPSDEYLPAGICSGLTRRILTKGFRSGTNQGLFVHF